MLRWTAFWLLALTGCGGSPPPPDAPTDTRIPSAEAGAERELPKAPKTEEATLPTACQRAHQKRLKAAALFPQGYSQRSRRLAEQAAKLCADERQPAQALLTQIEASVAALRGQPAADLWSKSEAARAAGDLPSARRLASAASTAFANAGTPVATWQGVARLHAVALSHNGDILAATDGEGKLLLLETRTLKPLRFLEVKDARGVKVAHFSPDGALLGVLTSAGVELIDTKSGARRRTLSWAGERLTQFAFSKDGSSVFVGGEESWNASVRRFDVASGDSQAEYQIKEGRGVASLAVSPRDGNVAVGLESGKLELLDGKKLSPVRALGDEKIQRIQALDFSPVGDRLAVLSGNTRLDVLDTATGKRITEASIDHSWGESICGFSSDGSRVRVNGGTWGDALLEIDAKDGHSLSAKRMPSRDQVLSPDGSLLVASASGGNGLFVVDTKDGEVAVASTTPDVRLEGMAFTDGALALARELPRTTESQVEVLLVSARNPEAHFLTVPGYKAELAFSQAGERLAGHFGGKSVFYWEVTASDKRQDLPDFPEWVNALSFSSKGVLHAAGGPFDLKLGTLRIGSSSWDIQTVVRHQTGGQAVALASGRAVVRQEGALNSYDLTLRSPDAQALPGGKDTRAFALSGDGKVLFVMSDKGTQRMQLLGSQRAQLLSGRCTRGPIAASRDGSVAVAACTYHEVSLFKDGDQRTAQLEVDDLGLSPSGEVVAIKRDSVVTLLGSDLTPRVDLRFTELGGAEATSASGALELLGEQGKQGRFCIVDQRAYPFELCEDQLLHDDLVVDALLPN
ncbi:MAG: WD40 repeat domain-containing protein [Polyangiaceae bacterium]